MKRKFRSSVLRLAALAAVSVLTLAGCSGGASTEQNPVTDGPTAGAAYNGPPAATEDIQAFNVAFWSKVRTVDRCGNCHNAGGQMPNFARSDDVNAAYQQASPIVDRATPSQSPLVLKVGGGHNCWLADSSACASILTRWITDWVGAASTGGKQIELVAPTAKDPGASRRFPADAPPSFYQDQGQTKSTYTLLSSYCSGCHRSDSATKQSPYFAAAIPPPPAAQTPEEAYDAAIAKINLESPADSRFVIRLRRESHNCWGDCAANATEMENAINLMRNDPQLAPVSVDPDLIVSKALTLYDGTVASGGNRVESSMIALYEFKSGEGQMAYDTAGVDPAADLVLNGVENTDYEWVGGWGVMFKTPIAKAQASTASSAKFQRLIGATGEYSIEAWVIPGNVTQEERRIVSYSGGPDARNFSMGQTLYNYDFLNRSTATGAAGTPAMSTKDAEERLQASLQHVVMTFDPVNGRRIYVNGEFTGDIDQEGGGSLGEWDNSFAFVLGNEFGPDNKNAWSGVIRLAAIHNRALTLPQIQQNYAAGVGQKYFMLFGVEHITNVPKSYVMFEASQYDSHGYLFNNPKFVSLDATAKPGSIALKGMRIGVNGAEPSVGQAYRLLDTTIADANYSAATGQTLSTVGTVIAVEKGPESDEFFLCFDQLGSRSNVCSTYARAQPVSYGPDPDRPADIGVRTFDEINATMAKVTGVDPNTVSIRDLYASMRQSLPATADFQAFLASHQSSIAQLAIQYCHVMTEDQATLRPAFYGAFDFNQTLNSGNVSTTLVNQVADKVMGVNLTSQPDVVAVTNELTNLVGDLCDAGGGCTSSSTVTVATAAKAVCAAALGSAVTVVK